MSWAVRMCEKLSGSVVAIFALHAALGLIPALPASAGSQGSSAADEQRHEATVLPHSTSLEQEQGETALHEAESEDELHASRTEAWFLTLPEPRLGWSGPSDARRFSRAIARPTWRGPPSA